MTIEDDLAEAMAEHVSGVRAAPDLGSAVRRRHRARAVRFRAAGAALVTAAVAVAVPVTLNVAGPATNPDAAMGNNRAVMRDDVIVPDTTSYRKPGIERNAFSVQVIVAHGASADRLYDFEFEPKAETVDIGGRPARLSRDGDSGPAGVSTPTIIWKLRDDLAVEVRVSPDYAKEIDAIGELRKIAEGIQPIR